MDNQRHFKIGEIAKRSGLSVDTLRYYEKRGLLTPSSRSNAGYRLYHLDSLQRIQFIQRSKALGFSLEEIMELMEVQHSPSAGSIAVKSRVEEKIAIIEQKMQHLQQLKDSLEQLNQLCSGEGSVADCPIIEYLNEQPDTKEA